MTDLILRATSKSAMRTWAQVQGLLIDDGEGGLTPRKGLAWAWWHDTGDFPTAPGVYDVQGVELTPPTIAPGVVLLLRIHHSFFDSDRLTPVDPENADMSDRSKIARAIKNNGTPGTYAGMNYYNWGGVWIFYRPAEVYAFIATKGVPGHRFS